MRCILHIGFGKTGTTALQRYLAARPVVDGPQPHRYFVVDHRGHVLRDADALNREAVSDPQLWERDDLDAIARRLVAAVPLGSRPILSQEAWSIRGREWLEADALNRLGLRAHVVAWVRPQIEWFNSGWWEWWAWLHRVNTPAELLKHWGKQMHWRAHLDAWAANPAVDKLTVRLYRRNTVSDFLALLGAPPPAPDASVVVNRSLAPVHIRLLKSMPGLRTPNRPWLDGLLQKLLPSTERAPWVLTPADMQRIVDDCRADNERLAASLAPEQADEMRRDPRWWSITPYLDLPAAQPADLKATRRDWMQAFSALFQADEGVRRKLAHLVAELERRRDGRGRFFDRLPRRLAARLGARAHEFDPRGAG